jgi:hypothetical protein
MLVKVIEYDSTGAPSHWITTPNPQRAPMKDSYECHITVPRDHLDEAETCVDPGYWRSSRIDGDPVLGKQVYGYLTAHDHDLQTLFANMDAAANTLRAAGVVVIREKIEHIIHDTKTGRILAGVTSQGVAYAPPAAPDHTTAGPAPGVVPKARGERRPVLWLSVSVADGTPLLELVKRMQEVSSRLGLGVSVQYEGTELYYPPGAAADYVLTIWTLKIQAHRMGVQVD